MGSKLGIISTLNTRHAYCFLSNDGDGNLLSLYYGLKFVNLSVERHIDGKYQRWCEFSSLSSDTVCRPITITNLLLKGNSFHRRLYHGCICPSY